MWFSIFLISQIVCLKICVILTWHFLRNLIGKSKNKRVNNVNFYVKEELLCDFRVFCELSHFCVILTLPTFFFFEKVLFFCMWERYILTVEKYFVIYFSNKFKFYSFRVFFNRQNKQKLIFSTCIGHFSLPNKKQQSKNMSFSSNSPSLLPKLILAACLLSHLAYGKCDAILSTYVKPLDTFSLTRT